MRAFLVLAIAIAAAGMPSGQSASIPPAAAELARSLQARYDTIQSFTAQFIQTYSGGGLGLTVPAEKGQIRVKKPGRFRMETMEPIRKTVGSDGTTFYFYDHKARTASEEPLPQGADAPTALLFIAGRGNLLRDFTPALAATQPEGIWQLELAPKTPNAEFKQLTLIMDRRSLALQGFAWLDHQGGTNTVRLEGLQENPTLADREFQFQIPAGVQRIKR